MTTQTNATDIRWALRVQPGLIRRLYRTDARGIVDEELIDKVGYALLDRCETIRRATERRCPECAEKLQGTAPGPRYRVITCPACNWSSTWGVYHRSYKRRRIHGGRAYPFFLKFQSDFVACRSPQEKMLAIDRLIHAVHESVRKTWTSPAASNLIEGKPAEIIAILDELAYGDQPGTLRNGIREDYQARMTASVIPTQRFREAVKKRQASKKQ